MVKKGLFITFEGGEGCGKTTQAQLLYEKLNNHYLGVLLTREPGGTDAAEKIRNILLNKLNINYEPITELLLIMAARNEHLKKVISPALDNNQIVICDRFIDSTLVYQGYGRGIDLKLINLAHKLFFGNITPDVTFLLGGNSQISLERVHLRGEKLNKYELLSNEFHDKIYKGFYNLAKKYKERMYVLDIQNSISSIHEEIFSYLAKFLSRL